MAVNQETLETLGGIKETVDSIKAGNTTAKDGVTDKEESLEKLVERLEQSLTDEMKEIIDAINGKNKKGKETKNAAANMFSEEDIEQLSGVVNGGTEEKITPPKSGKVAPNDLIFLTSASLSTSKTRTSYSIFILVSPIYFITILPQLFRINNKYYSFITFSSI